MSEKMIFLLEGKYFCPRLPLGSYPTEPNVWVSGNKVDCDKIAGANCLDYYPPNTCPIWRQAFDRFNELTKRNAQSQPKCTPLTPEGIEKMAQNTELVVDSAVNAQKIVRRIDAMEPGYSEAGD